MTCDEYNFEATLMIKRNNLPINIICINKLCMHKHNIQIQIGKLLINFFFSYNKSFQERDKGTCMIDNKLRNLCGFLQSSLLSDVLTYSPFYLPSSTNETRMTAVQIDFALSAFYANAVVGSRLTTKATWKRRLGLWEKYERVLVIFGCKNTSKLNTWIYP